LRVVRIVVKPESKYPKRGRPRRRCKSPWSVEARSLSYDRRPGCFRYLRHGLRNPIRFVAQREVSLRDDADHPIFRIDNRDPSHLMLLHQPLARFDVLALAAGVRREGDEFVDFRGFWIQTLRNHRAAQIAIRDHANQLARLCVGDDGYGTNVAIAKNFRDRLRSVGDHAAGWFAAHDVSDFHSSPPSSA